MLYNSFFVTILLICQGLVSAQDLSRICDLYNNSLTIVQPYMHNTITIWNVCENESSARRSHSFESIESTIISYDYDYRKNVFYYLRQDSELYQASLHLPENSVLNGTPITKKLASFSDLKPQKIALDWVHDLIYMIVDESSIFVTSLEKVHKEPILLLERQQASIKKLLVCSKLSIILWQEIEWSGTNHNRIWMAQQDGTESMVVHFSAHYIQDIQIDQAAMMLYFTTNSDLGMLSLKDAHQGRNYQTSGSIVQRFGIKGDIKHFSIMNPYIFMIQYGELVIQDLRNDKPSRRIKLFKSRHLKSIVQSQFLLIHERSQPKLDKLCPDKDSCEHICLPNGHIARYTCLCFHDTDSCSDYGHHSFDTTIKTEPETESYDEPEASQNQVETQEPEVIIEPKKEEKAFQLEQPKNSSVKRQVVHQITLSTNSTETLVSGTVPGTDPTSNLTSNDFPERMLKAVFEYLHSSEKENEHLDRWIHENRSLLFVGAIFGSFLLGFLLTSLFLLVCSLANRYQNSYTVTMSPSARKSIQLEQYQTAKEPFQDDPKRLGNLYVAEKCSLDVINNNADDCGGSKSCSRADCQASTTFYNPLFKHLPLLDHPKASAILTLSDTRDSATPPHPSSSSSTTTLTSMTTTTKTSTSLYL